LGLAIGNLVKALAEVTGTLIIVTYLAYGTGLLWLTISHLASSSTATATAAATAAGRHASVNGLEVNLIALIALFVRVQVVEAATQALPPNGRAADSQSVVGTEGEAGGVDGTCLRWVVKLELIVGGNVSSTSSLILENTTLEGQGESARSLTLWNISAESFKPRQSMKLTLTLAGVLETLTI
jgi:hypothetical protein